MTAQAHAWLTRYDGVAYWPRYASACGADGPLGPRIATATDPAIPVSCPDCLARQAAGDLLAYVRGTACGCEDGFVCERCRLVARCEGRRP